MWSQAANSLVGMLFDDMLSKHAKTLDFDS